jgi:mannose-6-phosphate isomerase-like protein (cupin superfamily)
VVTLGPTPADELLLEDKLKQLKQDNAVHPPHYRDCVIRKPWGTEFEMFDDKKHSVWMLNINKNKSTSLHCHQHKAVCLIPLVGELTLITLGGAKRILVPGDTISLLPKVFHCLWNGGTTELALIEIEQPSIKLDLIRAEDAYGRTGSAYEGEDHIVRENLDQYGYGRIGEDESITRYGYDISVDASGIRIRKPVDA